MQGVSAAVRPRRPCLLALDARRAEHRRVDARGEGIAGAAEHHDAHLVGQGARLLGERAPQRGRLGVALVGPVEGDDTHRAVGLDAQVGVRVARVGRHGSQATPRPTIASSPHAGSAGDAGTRAWDLLRQRRRRAPAARPAAHPTPVTDAGCTSPPGRRAHSPGTTTRRSGRRNGVTSSPEQNGQVRWSVGRHASQCAERPRQIQ